MPLHLDGKSKPSAMTRDWQRLAEAYEARIEQLETAAKAAIESLEMGRVDDAANALEQSLRQSG